MYNGLSTNNIGAYRILSLLDNNRTIYIKPTSTDFDGDFTYKLGTHV